MTLEVRDADANDLPFLCHLLRATPAWVLKSYRAGPTLVTCVNGQIASALFIGFNVNKVVPVGELLWMYTLPYFRRRGFIRRMWETHLNRTPMARYVANVPERALAGQLTCKAFSMRGYSKSNIIQFTRGIVS